MNSTVTKAELVKILSSETGYNPNLVKDLIESMLETISHSLTSGRRVELRGFGTWDVKISKPRVGRNPNHPEHGQVNIPPKPVVRFKVGKALKAAIQALPTNPTPNEP